MQNRYKKRLILLGDGTSAVIEGDLTLTTPSVVIEESDISDLPQDQIDQLRGNIHDQKALKKILASARKAK